MIKIVVLSDTHGYRRGLDEISDVLAENDMIIHLGDTSSDGSYLASRYKNTVVINGNCDAFPAGNDEQIIQAEGVKFSPATDTGIPSRQRLHGLRKKLRARVAPSLFTGTRTPRART